MKMESISSSETSAIKTQTPGITKKGTYYIIRFVIGECWEVWASNMDIKIYLMFRGPCILIYSYNKSHRDALELYVFQTNLLSIIRGLNTVFTAIGICLTSYVDCLLASSGWSSICFGQTY